MLERSVLTKGEQSRLWRSLTCVLWFAAGRFSRLRRSASRRSSHGATPDELRELVADVRETERQRIRRELHDGVAAALAGIHLRLETAAARLAGEPRTRALVLDAAAETAHTAEEIRRILSDLRPADLDDLGLPGALQRLVTRFEGAGPAVHVEIPEAPLVLPRGVEVAAYRIAGEGLANALRHASAGQVTVRLAVSDDELFLDVIDDGVGIPATGTNHGGLGLASMARRAAEVGGHCMVLPRPDVPSGALVRAVLPRRQV